MQMKEAISALDALAQATRMQVFRLLVRHGETGCAAGAIADELGVNPTTLSRHLARLEQAGLIASERQQRHILYRVQFAAMRELMAFLLEDCCASDPRICRTPAAQALTGAACFPTSAEDTGP